MLDDKKYDILDCINRNNLIKKIDEGEFVIVGDMDDGYLTYENIETHQDLIGGFVFIQFILTGFFKQRKPSWLLQGNKDSITVTRLNVAKCDFYSIGDDFAYEQYARWDLICDKLSSMDIDRVTA